MCIKRVNSLSQGIQLISGSLVVETNHLILIHCLSLKNIACVKKVILNSDEENKQDPRSENGRAVRFRYSDQRRPL